MADRLMVERSAVTDPDVVLTADQWALVAVLDGADEVKRRRARIREGLAPGPFVCACGSRMWHRCPLTPHGPQPRRPATTHAFRWCDQNPKRQCAGGYPRILPSMPVRPTLSAGRAVMTSSNTGRGDGGFCEPCQGGGKVSDPACADRTLVTCEKCGGTGAKIAGGMIPVALLLGDAAVAALRDELRQGPWGQRRSLSTDWPSFEQYRDALHAVVATLVHRQQGQPASVELPDRPEAGR